MKIIVYLSLFLLAIGFVSATEFGYDNPYLPKVNPPLQTQTTTSVNNNTLNVNNSQYWQGYTPQTYNASFINPLMSLFIRKDGTTTTTGRIPFAVGTNLGTTAGTSHRISIQDDAFSGYCDFSSNTNPSSPLLYPGLSLDCSDAVSAWSGYAQFDLTGFSVIQPDNNSLTSLGSPGNPFGSIYSLLISNGSETWDVGQIAREDAQNNFTASRNYFKNITADNIVLTQNITANNICYSNGTNCQTTSSATTSIFYQFQTDFMASAFSIFAPFGGTAISSGTVTNGDGEPNHFGVAQIRDSTTANGGYRIQTDITALRVNGTENFTAVFKPHQRNNQSNIYLGIQDATSATQPVDGCYFFIQNLTLSPRCSNNSVNAVAPTNLSLRNGTWYTAQIIINDDANYVNFTVWNSTGLLYNTNVSSRIPTTTTALTGSGVVATESTVSAGGPVFELDYMALTINRSVNRLV